MAVDKGTRPNIIMILSDDQGTWSLGSYGNPEIKTPVLDEMAAEGIRFENFFCSSPVCSPARASILTGKMPSQHGVLDWLGGGSVYKKDFEGIQINHRHCVPYLAKPVAGQGVIEEDAQIGFEETLNYQKFMNFEKGPIPFMEDHFCYTEALAEEGYACGLAGKWHLGNSYQAQKGFSFWEVIARGGTNYMLAEYIRDGKAVLEEKYVTDIITDDALRFLDEKKDGPFYLSVHYTAPHSPWTKDDQPQEIWDEYENCQFSYIPDIPAHPWQSARHLSPHSREERREYIQGFYTCVTSMDRNIGRIMDYLKEQHLEENTIVMFLSDNGFNLGHHGIWGKGNGTFPLNMYESSVKVPCIIWGNGVRKGYVSEALFSQYDLFPTILDLAGISPDKITHQESLPGSSLKPVLSGEKDTVRDEVVVYEEYGPVRMIRDERYKLIYRAPYFTKERGDGNLPDISLKRGDGDLPGGPHELYDLREDPEETHNLFDSPDLRETRMVLLRKLEQWFETYTTEAYDGRKFPVDGSGQMERLERVGTGSVVFRALK